jgi:hypothetical protein
MFLYKKPFLLKNYVEYIVFKENILLDQQRDVVILLWAWCVLIWSYSLKNWRRNLSPWNTGTAVLVYTASNSGTLASNRQHKTSTKYNKQLFADLTIYNFWLSPCGGPAISHHNTVSLVQWVNCLLPIKGVCDSHPGDAPILIMELGFSC